MSHRLRLLILGLLCAGPFLVAAPLRAQVTNGNPSEDDIQQMLDNPDASEQVRDRVQQSGMTPDQIRARLQAAGYSSNLLDRFLIEGAPGDSSKPTRDQLAAITTLGLAPAPASGPIQSHRVGGAGERARSPYFGVDVFRRTTTQFFPLFTGPVPDGYRLGPGDVPVLILTGDVESAQPIALTRDGFVVIPQVGQVYLSGLTIKQAKDVLRQRLSRAYSGIRSGSTTFEITISNVRAVTVYAIGEVAQPGAYQLSALGTVLTGIYAAGGPTDEGNLRAVEVRRGGALVATFDLYAYLLRGDTRFDLRLEDGDVINVPLRSRRVNVTGSISRPMIYDVADSESLAEVIANAGGLRPDASTTRLLITRLVPAAARRADGPQRMVLDIPLDQGKIPPVRIEDGDVIQAFSIDSTAGNYVHIGGAVREPGRFGLVPGMRLSQLVARAGGLRAATYTDRVLISRLRPSDSLRVMLTAHLPADSAAPWTEDPVLQEFDSVMVYSRPEMRATRFVVITGMVNEPGQRAFHERMTLRDLVLMGGGLRQGALLEYAEVARLPRDRTRGQLAETIRVPLDSTYLFDRDSAGRAIGAPGLGAPASGSREFALEPYDNVVIHRQPSFELQRTVRLLGEVRYPGTYSLASRNERLASVIDRAGGLTTEAYAAGGTLYRPLGGAGQINVDIEQALRRRNDRSNIVLQPGDSIRIPEFLPSVRVEGAVNTPGSVLWVPGKSVSYYIGAAGGATPTGDAGRASVRLANGSGATSSGGFLFFGGNDPEAGPGATVLVPVKPPQRENSTNSLALLAALSSIIASTAAVISLTTK
jgi:polysaccharide biosynthesis/export protein